MDVAKLDNPFVRVEWEDVPSAFTQERIKRVKAYFMDKYQTKNVQVKTISLLAKNNTGKLQSLELNDNILDSQFQKKLVREFMQQNDIKVSWDHINRLDDKVNSEIDKTKQNHLRYNKWFLKKIEFSNFLSFGKDNVLDYTQLGGITVVESDPPNFGGKTVLSVDLLLFLLFNTTTRSKTAEAVFNLYTEDNEVFVRGYLEIDNVDYIIERVVTRKKTKSGEWNVKTDLLFQKKNTDGAFENLSGEQRKETEIFIRNAIGDKEDFLATILSTANNLEELLEAKATARGQLLTKLIGLESIKEKEDVCKTMLSEWSKKLVSNSYNLKSLEADIVEKKRQIEDNQRTAAETKVLLETTQKERERLMKEKELLLKKQHQDIDVVLSKVNPHLLKREIDNAHLVLSGLVQQNEAIVISEPSSYYHEDQHWAEQKNSNTCTVRIQVLSNEEQLIRKQLKALKDGEFCPTCNRKLDDSDDHSAEIAALEEKAALVVSSQADARKLLKESEAALQTFQRLKKEFDEYDRQKLTKERGEVEIQQKKNELWEKENKYKRWEENRSKLEENLDLEQKLVSVKTKIDTKEGEVERIKAAINRCDQYVQQLSDAITASEELIVKIRKEEDVQKIFLAYLTIFGKNGITKSILKNMIPLINAELARILADSCPFTLEVHINEKNEVEFIMVEDETRVENTMQGGSGYEKTIASLALRCVLSKVSSLPKPNIVVLDEVFGKVANKNLPMVGEFFLKIKNYFENIILITHNELVKNWSDNTIMIHKENNISRIEKQTVTVLDNQEKNS